MTRLLALLALLALTACDKPLVGLPAATGAVPEVLVVSDSATWAGPVGDAIRQELARPISTLPNQQGFLKLRFQALADQFLPQIRRTRNVLFVAPIGAPTPIGRYLRARIPEGQVGAIESGRSVAVTIREDLWAAGQVAVTATAANDSLLANAIIERADSLRATYERNVLDWTVTQMFDRARQTEVEDTLIADKGWAFAIQHDFIEVQDTTASAAGRTGSFVRFRRIVPETWRDFFVFVQDGVTEVPPVEELDAMTDDLLEQFAVGEIDSTYIQTDPRRPVMTEAVELAGRPAVETRGLWRMIGFPMGGPYIRYAFIDEGRLFVYYGMVFSPSPRFDKREFLRQLEATATTFYTARDLAEREAAMG